tara:strand:+ start:67 stop:417 length:351 start_codon:yes stop_codon:yes gene_type:complete
MRKPNFWFSLSCFASFSINLCRSFKLYGDQMNKKTSVDLPDQINKKDNLSLPSFSDCFEAVLEKGELLQVDGTNVVRVPFGIRQPKKKRPAKLSTWATLVLPLQSFDSPTPPPHAA